jgi:hypothetical protein
MTVSHAHHQEGSLFELNRERKLELNSQNKNWISYSHSTLLMTDTSFMPILFMPILSSLSQAPLDLDSQHTDDALQLLLLLACNASSEWRLSGWGWHRGCYHRNIPRGWHGRVQQGVAIMGVGIERGRRAARVHERQIRPSRLSPGAIGWLYHLNVGHVCVQRS